MIFLKIKLALILLLIVLTIIFSQLEPVALIVGSASSLAGIVVGSIL